MIGGAVSAADVHQAIVTLLAEPRAAARPPLEDLPDGYNLLGEGLIDSFGLLELIGLVEERFGLELDFEQLDPEDLTTVGPLSRFVAEASRVGT